MKLTTLYSVAALAAMACAQPAAKGAVVADSVAEAGVRYDHAEFAAEKPIPESVLANPVAGTPKLAAEGAKLFVSMNCDGCHGGGGPGFIGPSLSDGRFAYGKTDRAVFETIYYGRPNGMPGFGSVIGPDVIWRLVAYVKSLPPPAQMPTQSW